MRAFATSGLREMMCSKGPGFVYQKFVSVSEQYLYEFESWMIAYFLPGGEHDLVIRPPMDLVESWSRRVLDEQVVRVIGVLVSAYKAIKN